MKRLIRWISRFRPQQAQSETTKNAGKLKLDDIPHHISSQSGSRFYCGTLFCGHLTKKDAARCWQRQIARYEEERCADAIPWSDEEKVRIAPMVAAEGRKRELARALQSRVLTSEEIVETAAFGIYLYVPMNYRMRSGIGWSAPFNEGELQQRLSLAWAVQANLRASAGT